MQAVCWIPNADASTLVDLDNTYRETYTYASSIEIYHSHNRVFRLQPYSIRSGNIV